MALDMESGTEECRAEKIPGISCVPDPEEKAALCFQNSVTLALMTWTRN